MDILSIMARLENKSKDRSVENMSGFAGFRDADVCVWRGIPQIKVNSNALITGVWKVFVLDDLEGIWYLVVLQQLNGKVVSKVFAVSCISSLSFS